MSDGSDTVSPPPAAAAAGSFRQRRIVAPIVAQFRQGITPEKIALTIALGAVLAVFPILGSTTILCALAALWLRLNQPIIQLVNYLAYPLQLLLLIPLYRAGEVFGVRHLALSIPEMVERFRAGPLQFILDFGIIALGGVAAWCLLAPLVAGALYYALRPALRALASRTRRDADAAG
ncbi:MAG: hypothetical protein NVS9B10_01520 [Nevskia sp.]